jgi:hypothetical protein
MKSLFLVEISALCAFLKSMIPIVVIRDFYLSGSGLAAWLLFGCDARLHSHASQCASLHPEPAVQRAGKDRAHQLAAT